MIAIGIGANSKACADDFAAVLADICRETHCDAVATLEGVSFYEVLRTAASPHSLRCREIPPAELRGRNQDCQTSSKRTMDQFGIQSIAETSALVAAGAGSHLLIPRRTIGNITLAVATSEALNGTSQ